MRTVIDHAVIATVDAHDTEHRPGHVVVEDGWITAVGPGPAPTYDDAAGAGGPTTYVDARRCLVTPGLVNTHHHFFQWLTRGLVQDGILFDWLTGLYPRWALLDEAMVHAAATGSMASLLRSGCTTAADHHYVFPRGAGDLLSAEVDAARRLGLRLHATRGSMDLGESDGGLPPDTVVESIDAVLEASRRAVDDHHDTAPDAMVRVALAPCSPFSVTTDLLRESAALARDLGVRLHTHGAETLEEEAWCRERFGLSPADHLAGLGWTGDDVWMAHCVHLSDADIATFAATGTGVAHCPSSNARLGAGIARVPELLAAGVPVGLGVDGTASNESGSLGTELRAALLLAQARLGPGALTARQALRIATIGGARLLGRDAELGSLEAGKLADLAVWDLDTAEHAGIEDEVAALVMGALPPLRLLLVGGRPLVEHGLPTTYDDAEVAAVTRAEAGRLARLPAP